MKILEPASPVWTGRALSVLRIVVSFLFILHGTAKLFGFPAGDNPSPPPAFLTQIWFAGVLEAFGGSLVLIGLLTRPIAFLLCGQMAVAYFQAHFPRSFWPSLNGGELAVLFCFAFLYLSVAGAGPWSVDAILARSRRTAE